MVGDGGAGVGEGGDGVPVEVIVKTTASPLARKHVPLLTLPYPLSPQSVPHEFLINQ